MTTKQRRGWGGRRGDEGWRHSWAGRLQAEDPQGPGKAGQALSPGARQSLHQDTLSSAMSRPSSRLLERKPVWFQASKTCGHL